MSGNPYVPESRSDEIRGTCLEGSMAAEGRDGWLGAFTERRLRQTLKLVLPRNTICIGRGQDLLLAAAAKSYLES